MRTNASKVGAIIYVLWGLLHMLGGISLLQQLAAEGVRGALTTLGSAVPGADLPTFSDGVTVAVLAFFAFNWIWIGLLVVVIAVRLNWKNSRVGYWLNLAVAGAADLGLIIFLVAPGLMALSDGWPGPLLWLLAAVFSTMGMFNQDTAQMEQAAPA